MTEQADDHNQQHDHQGGHDHGHGHENDQGFKAIIRYLRFAPQMWRSTINDAVIELLAPKEGERVVDIGAGMGAGTVVALKAGAAVTAVEPTPFMRRTLTARRLFQAGRNRLTIVDGAAEKMPVPDGSVDALWSVNAMHHWVDPGQAAVEIARVLRAGGRLVLVDEDFADPTHPDHERFGSNHGSDSDDGKQTHDDESDHHHGFTMVDATEMGELLSSAGLTDVVAEKRSMAEVPVIAVTAVR